MIVKKSRYLLKKSLLRKGTKTAPILVKKENKRFVFKVFGRGVGFSQQEVKTLSRQVSEYHKVLKSTGLRVSNILGVSPIHEIVEKRSTGKWLLAAKEQFIGKGKDVLQTMNNCSESKAKNLFGQMLQQLNLVTSHNSAPNKPVQVLIDSVPKNWVEGKNGQIVYIDFFTPKFLDSKGKLSPFYKKLHTRSKSHLQFRYQNKGGIYSVLLTYLVAERPASRAYFERTLLNFLNKNKETSAAKKVEETIAVNYNVNFINPKVTKRIPLQTA